MARLVVLLAGDSLAQRVGGGFPGATPPALRDAADTLWKRVRSLDPSRADSLAELSDELGTLSRLQVGLGDYVVLFASDDPAVAVSAQVVARYLMEVMGCDTLVEQIPRLYREPLEKRLRELSLRLVDMVDNPTLFYGYEFLISTVGSPAPFVPYLCLLAFSFGLPLLHATSGPAQHATVPSLMLRPVARAFELMGDRFSALAQRGAMDTSAFWHGIIATDAERQAVRSLLSQEAGQTQFNPAGFILYRAWRHQHPPPIPRSTVDPVAKDQLRDVGSLVLRRAAFDDLRRRLCAHPYVNRLHFVTSCDAAIRHVIIRDWRLRASCERIVMEVETTATHCRHLERIRDELQALLP